LMNVRYVVTPKNIESKPFWEKINETNSWNLYKVPTSGYFTTGSHAAVVYSKKQHYVNLVRLWMQSDYVKKQIFPQLTFSYTESTKNPLRNFQMIDEATYTFRGAQDTSLFDKTPVYEAPTPNMKLVGPEEVNSDMIYKTKISVDKNCIQCLAILKVSDHPNWLAYVNGKRVNTVTVFPFYIGIPLQQNTEALIEIRYQPSNLKLLLMIVGIVIFIFISYRTFKSKNSS
jgi:hypothetical protein